MKPDICIYHGNCADGFTAAWVVYDKFGDAVQFIPGFYGKEPPDVTGKHVLMVDFSFKKPVLESMSKSAATITILDHHKTAQADLETFAVFNPVDADNIDAVLAATQPGLGNVRAIFDMNRSGAQITWDFFCPGMARPRLVNYVADRDLWQFKLPKSREVQEPTVSASSPGEKRRRKAKRERERAAYASALAALPVGSCCGNCAHRGTMPLSRKPICTLNSDFNGYSVVKLEHVCPQWTAK